MKLEEIENLFYIDAEKKSKKSQTSNGIRS